MVDDAKKSGLKKRTGL